MSVPKFSNNFATFLTGAISDTDTAINVDDASAAPSLGAGEFFTMTLVRGASRREIVKVTAVTGDQLTVERGHEGTDPLSWSAEDIILHTATAGSYTWLSGEYQALADSIVRRDENGQAEFNDPTEPLEAANKQYVDGEVDATNSDLQTHIDDSENPHGVTKSQVGLGNVTNDAQVKQSNVGAAPENVPTNEDLPNSSSTGTQADHGSPSGVAKLARLDRLWSETVGTQSDHESPEDKSLLARLDHLEAALGIDTTGPAGANVLAAVGRGAIVESGSNSNGHYVRWENGEQVCFVPEALTLTVSSDGNESGGVNYPASFTEKPTIVIGLEGEDDGGSRTARYGTYDLGTSSVSIGAASESNSTRTWVFYVTAWGFWK